MIFQYQDEDAGEPVQMYILACIEKVVSSDRFLMLFHVISWDYDDKAAAVLRHAECPEVRQSQQKKTPVTVKLHNCVGFVGQTMN